MEHNPRFKILVVDDHEDNVELLKARLEARGYEVAGANDGQSALDKVGSWCPDLILLDVMMPKMDGMEVARRLKARIAKKEIPFTPIIMQTALDSTENKVEGMDAGADDYITKPINFTELEVRVQSMLRIKSLNAQLESSNEQLGVANERLEQSEKELKEANEQLRKISVTDGLTGIENRRSLEKGLSDMWDHSVRLHEDLSVVMCDIDKFKSVNDNHGHQAGDAVLKQVAQLIKEEARKIDRVGRYGGEEFLLLLPGTVLDAAVTFAERLREKVEGHTFSYEGGVLRRTISCGVAAQPHPRVKDQEQLVRAADDALYVAKETGRNRVVRFDSAEFNGHIEAKGNNSTDGEKPVKETGGGSTPSSPLRASASAEGERATA